MTSPATVPPSSTAAPVSRRFATLSQMPAFRLLCLFALILLLNIPQSMVRSAVNERESRRNSAAEELAGQWGPSQQISGLLLRVPYLKIRQTKGKDGKWNEERESGTLTITPQTLNGSASLNSQLRMRGIFALPVYQATVHLSGQFGPQALAEEGLRPEDLQPQFAALVLGVTQPSALQGGLRISANGQALAVQPNNDGLSGVRAPLVLNHATLWHGLQFDVAFTLNGMDSLHLLPLANDNRIHIDGNWPHPSFNGYALPVKHSIGAQGFSADYSVSDLGRAFPRLWTGNLPKALRCTEECSTQGPTGLGLRLETPNDAYRTADRIAKYASLLMLLSFGALWLMETVSGKRLASLQYGFIGGALALFGLLQLSFAEHFGVNAAYAVSATTVVVMVSLYCHAALQHLGRSLIVAATLSLLYGCLFLILGAEDYALLAGSLLLTAALAAAMWGTRKPAAAPLACE